MTVNNEKPIVSYLRNERCEAIQKITKKFVKGDRFVKKPAQSITI